jgi:hypothetical protein
MATKRAPTRSNGTKKKTANQLHQAVEEARKAIIGTHVSTVINAFEEGLPDFLRDALIDALNRVAVKAQVRDNIYLSYRRPPTGDEISAIIAAEAQGDYPPPKEKEVEPHLSGETVRDLAKSIVGFEDKRLADALLILAREFELAGDRGSLDLEGMVIDIEEAILPFTTSGQELRRDITRDLHNTAVLGTFKYPRS